MPRYVGNSPRRGIPIQRAVPLGCGPNAEQDTFTARRHNTVYGTRNTLLNPNYCPGAETLCFGYGNTFTKLVANSIYHSGEVTVERKAGDVTFLAAYTLAKAIDDSSAFGELINFSNAKLSRGLSSTDVHQNFVVSYVWEMPFHRIFHGLPRLTKGWQCRALPDSRRDFRSRWVKGIPYSQGPLCPSGNCAREMPRLPAAPPPICRISWVRFTNTTPAYSRYVHIFQPERIYRNACALTRGGFDRP